MKFDDGCGRYTLSVKGKDLQKRYNLAKEPKDVKPSYDVKPGQTLPVITANEDGSPKLDMMRWGLVPVWAKDPKMGYKLFNARDDHLFTSGIWKQVIYKKRGLVPATGYFEWTKPAKGSKEPKQKFFFRPKKLEIFSFAGIWSTWKDVEGKEWKTYSLITTEPNKEAAKVHDRMPVIIAKEDEASWLEPSKDTREDIEPFLHPLEDNGLEVVEVNSDVSAWEYDDEQRIAPLNSQ